MKLFTAAALTALLASPALAEMPDLKSLSPEQRREAVKNFTPEQREKFHSERKAHWQSLDKQEKVKLIEDRRAKFRAERDAKWNSMSDDEKIKHAEQKMQKRKQRRSEQ